MADDFDVSLTNNFDLNLGSSLRHYCRASQKLQLLTKKSVELKLNNQIHLTSNDNNVDLSVKTILDEMQNVRSKLDTIEHSVDFSNKVEFNLEETVNEIENIIDIISKNKNTIFSHRNLL
ncbi:uncharacterized protein LOC112688511 [Sipha flava]|uniref:Uncharacterized protein LOC112688511 n=1 Tax=Sipha flava TaxID=143950 RepID=A0A8B8G3J6_9HEMI|nr:uncharacterized protein LOC112688511 [Sipha flava]